MDDKISLPLFEQQVVLLYFPLSSKAGKEGLKENKRSLSCRGTVAQGEQKHKGKILAKGGR